MKKILTLIMCAAILFCTACAKNGEDITSSEQPHNEELSQQIINEDLKNKNSENSDAVLWLKMEGCEIDNPVFQGEDNDEYLRLDENGQGNIWGCYFLDYINKIENGEFVDKVNIIYGHSKNDDPNSKKFSKLKRYKDEKFAKENPSITLDLLYNSTNWQIFAATDIPIEIDYIDPNPDDEKYAETLNYMLENSYVDFGVDVTTEDQILVLSTCTSDENVRFVVAAVLN